MNVNGHLCLSHRLTTSTINVTPDFGRDLRRGRVREPYGPLRTTPLRLVSLFSRCLDATPSAGDGNNTGCIILRLCVAVQKCGGSYG